MANKRYQLWDEVSPVITPIGEVLSPEEWMDRYPMARLEGLQLVLAGGQVNGAFCGVYSELVDMYEKQGCDFSNCKTQQEHLDAIEAFENARNAMVAATPTFEERMAAALEAQVMMSMMDVEVE